MTQWLKSALQWYHAGERRLVLCAVFGAGIAVGLAVANSVIGFFSALELFMVVTMLVIVPIALALDNESALPRCLGDPTPERELLLAYYPASALVGTSAIFF